MFQMIHKMNAGTMFEHESTRVNPSEQNGQAMH